VSLNGNWSLRGQDLWVGQELSYGPRDAVPVPRSQAYPDVLEASTEAMEREGARLAALERYRVLDTDAEAGFDDLTRLAAHVCGTPIALVSLVDQHRQWFKSRLGLDVCSTDRDVAFCAHALTSPGLMVVPDALADPRFAANPLVLGAPHIRFYAGAPLVTPEGHILGTLCVLDTTARQLSVEQAALLIALASQVMVQLEHRRIAHALASEVADHQLAREQLKRRKLFQDAVLETVDAGVIACDANGTVVLRNAAHRRATGIDDGEDISQVGLTGRIRLLHADGDEVVEGQEPLYRALAGEDVTAQPMQVGDTDGSWSDILVTARQILGGDGELLGAVSAFTDVTKEHQAHERLKKSAAFHDAVLAASPDMIFIVDPRTNATLWCTRNLMSMLSYTDQDMHDLGETVIETLVHPDDRANILAANLAARDLEDGEVLQIRYRVRHANGHWIWIARRVTPFARDGNGDVAEILGIARDITDITEAEAKLEYAALHDPLTGLPNRMLLADRLQRALTRARRTGLEQAVLFCDLDGFKHVNDTGGHHTGDHVLATCADRLRAALRPEDTIARVGGDEFVVLVEPGLKREPKPFSEPVDVRSDAIAIADRLLAELARPIPVDGTDFTVSVSIGISFADAHSDPEQLLRNADIAMYQAKTNGKNRQHVYEPPLARAGFAQKTFL
jgi:diguanylate cyclase (GGDEF)-like protein/PAS domain S-box-containing protein